MGLYFLGKVGFVYFIDGLAWVKRYVLVVSQVTVGCVLHYLRLAFGIAGFKQAVHRVCFHLVHLLDDLFSFGVGPADGA